jgi:hypothetical protein
LGETGLRVSPGSFDEVGAFDFSVFVRGGAHGVHLGLIEAEGGRQGAATGTLERKVAALSKMISQTT